MPYSQPREGSRSRTGQQQSSKDIPPSMFPEMVCSRLIRHNTLMHVSRLPRGSIQAPSREKIELHSG